MIESNLGEKLAYSAEQFASAYGVGRTNVFEEIAAGRLKTYRVGRRRYISARAAQEWQMLMESRSEDKSKE